MGVQHPRLASPSWVRLPRRTARLRLTAFYGGLFLLTGAALAAITYVLFERATDRTRRQSHKVRPEPAQFRAGRGGTKLRRNGSGV